MWSVVLDHQNLETMVHNLHLSLTSLTVDKTASSLHRVQLCMRSTIASQINDTAIPFLLAAIAPASAD